MMNEDGGFIVLQINNQVIECITKNVSKEALDFKLLFLILFDYFLIYRFYLFNYFLILAFKFSFILT